MHEIMLDTKVALFISTENNLKDRNFVMAFGDVSKSLFGDLAEYKYIKFWGLKWYSSLNDKNLLTKCLKIFGVWEKEFLFKKEFIKKLAAIIQNKVFLELKGLSKVI